MAEANVFEQGFDRFQETVKDLDREVQRVRRQIVKRRRSFERDLKSRRSELERRAQRQIRRIRSELRKNPTYKRAESFQADVRERLESQIDTGLGAIPIASKTEVVTLERRIARLTKRVRELEKVNGKGVAESA